MAVGQVASPRPLAAHARHLRRDGGLQRRAFGPIAAPRRSRVSAQPVQAFFEKLGLNLGGKPKPKQQQEAKQGAPAADKPKSTRPSGGP